MKNHTEDKGFWSSLFDLVLPKQEGPSQNQAQIENNSNYNYQENSIITSPWYPVTTKSFDGEKTPGEMGPAINLVPEHNGLRYRSYEAQLKSDVVKMITGKFFKWVIGNGLKLQSEPEETVLEMEGVKEDFIKFRKNVEARFKVYSNSKMSDFSRMQNIHKRASEAFKTAFLSGDALVILRVENGNINVQVIDGAEVKSPVFDSEFYKKAKDAGNDIIHGIEMNDRGEHVAFFVRKKDSESGIDSFERIPAKGEKSGRLMAWLIYGDKHRINHHRGIPQISAILEKVDKLDRYTEASVAGAEERAKIVFAVEHNQFSTGENPLLDAMRKNMGNAIKTLDPYEEGKAVSKAISQTTNKQTFNLPIGSKLTTLASQQEDQYQPFFDAVFVQLCSAIDIPPEVALQKYSSNYSASRAAINGWGYIVDIYRKDFTFDYYKNIYRLWLELEVLKGKIQSPGLLKASINDDDFLIEAFTQCKFTGVNMPHIDPLKEVKAVREMLGDPANGIVPLISHDNASEQLNQGEWSENYLKYKEEIKSVDFPKLETSNLTKPKKNESL